MPRDDNIVDVSGRGIEFILKFRDQATEELQSVSTTMQKVAEVLEKNLRSMQTGTDKLIDGVRKMAKESEKSHMVGVMGATPRATEAYKSLMGLVDRMTLKLTKGTRDHRLETEQLIPTLGKYSDALDDMGDQADDANDSLGTMFGNIAKGIAGSYGLKKMFDFGLGATVDYVDVEAQLAKLYARLTVGNPEARKAVGTLEDMIAAFYGLKEPTGDP